MSEPAAIPRRGSQRGRLLRSQLAAVTLLTRLPLGRTAFHDAESVAQSAPAFPLVGAGVGAAVGGIAAALSGSLSALLAAAIGIAAGVVLTGALHLDAIADTADALGAGTRERALEIMRDHAVGAYGAAALALDLLIKTAALTALVQSGNALAFAVVAGALSRSSAVVLSASLPYARPDAGVGAVLGGDRLRAGIAVAFALAIAVGVGGGDGALLSAVAAAIGAALWLTYRRWLRGVTGDTLGAAIELCELAVLVGAVALKGAA